MIRETKYIKVYPNKSVIEDLLTRTGPANSESFSPFEGKQHLIDKQFKTSIKHKFRLRDFIEHNRSRDLDPARAKVSNKYGMLVEAGSEEAGCKTLEDMFVNGVEIDHVEKYIDELLIGYKIDNTSPYNKYQEYSTKTVRNIDGDGDDEIEEKFLIQKVDEQHITNEEYELILKELPYVIKSIWSYSKLYQANLFSFIFAYYDIIKSKRKRTVSISDFMGYTTYLIKKDGTYERPFRHADDNKYTIYPRVTKIFIAPGSHQTEFNLCMKFLTYLEILGIDYRDENPADYTKEFIDSIVCTYLPSNDEYFEEYKDVDVEILAALNPKNVFTVTKSFLYLPTRTEKIVDYSTAEYFINERIRIAFVTGDVPDGLLIERDDLALSMVKLIMRIYSGKEVNLPAGVVTFDGMGLAYMGGELLKLPGKYFGTFRGSDDYNVVLTRYGFVVPIEESFTDVFYLSYDDCYSALKECVTNGEVQEEANWGIL